MVEINRPSGETEMAKKFEPVERSPNAPGAVNAPHAIGVAADQPSEAEQKKVTVKALKHFHKEADMRGDMVQPGDTFETTQQRAVELRANGLIEYGDGGDEKAMHGEVGAKAISDRLKRESDAATLKDKDRSTPLRNPKLEFAEVDETQAPASPKSKKSTYGN